MKPLSAILVSFPRMESALENLRRRHPGCEVRVAPAIGPDGRLDPTLLRGAEAAVVEMIPSNYEDFDRLRFLQLASVGFEQLENVPLLKGGVQVSNARGVFDPAIAEWNLLMMLVWQRRLPEMMENQRRKVWDRSSKFQNEIRGSTIGFYGYGGIARETARLAKALGVTVWVLTREGSVRARGDTYGLAGIGDPDGTLPDRFFSPSDRRAFFAGLDYLILTIPLTPASRGIVTEADLRGLKPSAVLINPARAALVGEAVLIRALREKWIRGASFDVHYSYPPSADHPLWSMPEIVLTPHISGSSGSSTYPERVYDLFTQNLQRLETGRPLLNRVTERDVAGA